MKQKILELLTEHVSLEIEDFIELLQVENYEEFLKTLNELVASFDVYATKKGKYMLFANSHLLKGKIEITAQGNGFLLQEDEDVFISSKKIGGATNQDTVVVELIKSSGKKREGKVLAVVSRDLASIVGVVYIKDDVLYINSSDRKQNGTYQIAIDKHLGAVEGDVVKCVEIKKINNFSSIVEVTEIVAAHNHPDKDMLLIMAKFNIEAEFNEEVKAATLLIPDHVDEEEMAKRVDLRDQFIFTIDGSDTKDIDDAISIDKTASGYRLGVHIADVAHYVKDHTPIGDTAYNRGTSVYLVDRVVPMLPKKLSNGICSLNPGVDRLAMTADIQLDEHGKVISYELYESVINSRKQCTYEAVNQILEQDIIPEGYEAIAAPIQLMKELSDLIKKQFIRRGFIEFEDSEVKFILEEGKIIDIKRRERGSGEVIIENFMITANEVVASFITEKSVPSVYRVHDKPSLEKINEFIAYASLIGITMSGLDRNKKEYSSADVQKLMIAIKDKEQHSILSDLLLRSMKKAIYSPDNIGHFGIASKCYTHFTSPIRRFPDTIIHRILKAIMHKDEIDKSALNKYLVVACEHCSDREQAAVDCEREVDDMKMAEYMTEHIGEEFDGMISSVLPFGLFVELDNLIEGLVRVDSLNGYFHFDENNKQLVSGKQGVKYRLGDKIRVKCVRADKFTREIDFEVVNG